MELFQDLRNLKSTVEPKFRQLNIEADEVECVFKLMIDRMECMEKGRKLKRQLTKASDCEREDVDSFCSEF